MVKVHSRFHRYARIAGKQRRIAFQRATDWWMIRFRGASTRKQARSLLYIALRIATGFRQNADLPTRFPISLLFSRSVAGHEERWRLRAPSRGARGKGRSALRAAENLYRRRHAVPSG